MLPEVVTLHDPACSGRCDFRCVTDLEKFCWDVAARHLGAGAKSRLSGRLQGGGGWLTATDADDLHTYLISVAWRESTRFRADDDGRQSNRLSGWLLMKCHYGVTDWLRQRLGSTRYGPLPDLVPYVADVHDNGAVVHDEYPSDDELDLSDAARAALKLLAPLADGVSQKALAERTGVPPSQIGKAVQLVRAEAALNDDPSPSTLLAWLHALRGVRTWRSGNTRRNSNHGITARR